MGVENTGQPDTAVHRELQNNLAIEDVKNFFEDGHGVSDEKPEREM